VAITEGERAAPDLLADLARRLDAHGLAERSPLVRLTGCPNGCARPYDAELGIVGQGVGTYALFLGGHPEGDRLAFLAAEKVPLAEIGPRLEPLLAAWAQTPGLGLGDFACNLGAAKVRALLAVPELVEA
jgi:sulfite reductase beta subunit-like hemoprotein